MEISGRFIGAARTSNEPASPLPGARASSAPAAPVRPVAAVQPHLEPLCQALRALPEVDLEKVQALKAALANGTFDSDPLALARAILERTQGGRR